ncbi:MAG: cupin domain-containing protein [Trueperaceae bacterium]|nr:cupin domain-containing protein [Trueperaceae bacterium]
MTIVTISDARRFSLDAVQRSTLLREGGLEVELLCFEAGQRDDEDRRSEASIYQVMEGEALLHVGDERHRIGKGKLAAVSAEEPHVIENAGGGLLVVMAHRARSDEG